MVKLLSPAGNLEKLKYAVQYGADAVYLGGKNFSMRANANNFSNEQLIQGIEYAHSHDVSVNVAVNIAAENKDIKPMIQSIKDTHKMGANR